MTVSVDAVTENVRTDTASPQTFSHAGASSGVKGFLLSLIHNVSSTDHVSAASYGGVSLTRVKRNVDTSGEPGAAEWWFLGSSVPQGTQTVSYTPGSTDDDIQAVAITLLGSDNLEIVDSDGIDEDVADPSVTLNYGGRTCMAFGALFSGNNNPANLLPNASCTTLHDHDFGTQSSKVIRQTTAGSSDFAIGFTVGSTSTAYAAVAVSEVAAANWTLAVDSASFDVDGQVITLNQTWSTTVTKADLQPSPSSLVLNQALVLTQADIQPAGQEIALNQSWSVVVTQADLQPAGQDITLAWTQNWFLAVDKADLQPTGQDITLLAGGDTPVTVDSAAFSLSGSAVDLVWTTNVQEQVYSGGWVESAYEKRYAQLNDEIRRELEEEREREELAERLEKVLVQEGTLTQAQADLIRLRGLAEQYNRDDLPNRARRSLAFAERAQSEFAAKLALRELKRLDEEEEYAVLLLMALD